MWAYNGMHACTNDRRTDGRTDRRLDGGGPRMDGARIGWWNGGDDTVARTPNDCHALRIMTAPLDFIRVFLYNEVMDGFGFHDRMKSTPIWSVCKCICFIIYINPIPKLSLSLTLTPSFFSSILYLLFTFPSLGTTTDLLQERVEVLALIFEEI